MTNIDFLSPCQVFDTQYLIWKDFVEAINQDKTNYTNLFSSRMTTDFIEKIYNAGEDKLSWKQ